MSGMAMEAGPAAAEIPMIRRSLILAILSVIIAILPAVAESERQRIAASEDARHSLDGELSWNYLAVGGALLVGANGSCGYEYRNRWRFGTSVPFTLSVTDHDFKPAVGLGDASVEAERRFEAGDLRFRLGAAWTFPTGEADYFRIREGFPAGGSGTHQLELRGGISALRDPVILAAMLHVAASLPAVSPQGFSWQGASASLSVSLHEVLNEAVSWSLVLTPSADFPSWHNGRWLSQLPAWSTAFSLQIGWYPGDWRIASGIRYVGDGGWAITGSIGGVKEWLEEE